jgi:hypothetical protein
LRLREVDEQLRNCISGHGFAEQKSLALVRTIRKCSVGLSDIFDALGGNAQIETFAEPEYSSHEDIAFGAFADLLDKPLVDLELIEPQFI